MHQERRRVAVAMEPVRVRANSDMTANVRTKIIMINSCCKEWHAGDQTVPFVFSHLHAL
jgi:hypothetical protein